MSKQRKKSYWMNLAERDGTVERALIDSERDVRERPLLKQPSAVGLSRRQFLEAAGFTISLAALSGCRQAAEEVALPFTSQPVGRVPGRLSSYASTCHGCSAGCGLLIGVRDGRPLKMEGMPEHPLSQGGLCAVGQALPLDLYDSHRLDSPLHKGKKATWSDVDATITARLQELAGGDGAIRFVTPTVTSPTLQATIDRFLKRFQNARHVTFDAASCSAILDAHQRTHGRRVLPHFQLDKAQVIVSFGADFLGTWISPVEFTAAWSSRRVPVEGNAQMSYHVQLESRMSLTGSNADRRVQLAPDEYGSTLSHLASELALRAGETVPDGPVGVLPIAKAELADIVERLWHARGECLVVCDSQDVENQVLVNAINHYLKNYGHSVDIVRASRQKRSNDADVLELLEELKSGRVSALFVAGTDLIHNLPSQSTLSAAIDKVPLVVSFAERLDEMASHSHFVCPDLHPLQAWLDAEPVRGLVSLTQPTMSPLGDARSILESLARWSGQELSARELVQDTWKRQIYPRVDASSAARKESFQMFWDQSVHDGFVVTSVEGEETEGFESAAVRLLGDRPAAQNLALELYWKVGMPGSRHAQNAWLQELPDPITKVTWDNYICVSESLARDMKLSDGDVVALASADGSCQVELPALVQPGQHNRVLAVALAYGVKGTDRFAGIGPTWLEARPTTTEGTFIGKNAAAFIKLEDGTLRYACGDVTVEKTDRRHHLATTQRFSSLTVPAEVAPHGAEVREPIQATTLEAFGKDAQAGAPHQHHAEEQLWPEDHPHPGHSWGMVIDLNKCSGCSACLIACQSENNVPVVGRDEVRRQREMHWIRIDRYYSGGSDDVRVAYQPMMCQHCGNAPCETVCPVLATVHGEEGLNEQAYNRCVGTRYCANNCPYKVRRFNWFRYQHDDEVQNLALNPDVTVRARGVMEKCSMCVQRIEEAKIDARRRNEPLSDGAALTACQQSCPARAIEFGDLNDPASRVHRAAQDPRKYGVLEEFNFRPSVAYLRVVNNSGADEAEDAHHG